MTETDKPDSSFLDVMVDLETAGTSNNAVVLSIAWIPFSINAVDSTGDAGPCFGVARLCIPSIREQLAMGREVDPRTMQGFWAKQPAEAREHWAEPASTMPMERALSMLRETFNSGTRVWAHGICFDIGILDSLYRALGKEAPWAFNDVRDARTIYRLLEPRRSMGAPTFVPHHPVDDCRKQIWQLWERWPAAPAE